MALRKIVHIECGGEDWNPTAEELHQIGTMFIHAQQDAAGGVVTTRNDIKITEVEVDDAAPIFVNGRKLEL